MSPAPLCAWCGASMDPPPTQGTADWGDWQCPVCHEATCQDCGARVSYYGICLAYEKMQEEFANQDKEPI